MVLHIDTAQPDDREAIVTLLRKTGLLTDDLPTDLSDFLLAWDGANLVGVAGLERHVSVGFLRSVAVDPAHRHKGIANQLVDHLLTIADAAHVQPVYLVTTTAERYLGRHAFSPVHRDDVPDAIRQTRQFSGLCPASAVVMKRIAPQPV